MVSCVILALAACANDQGTVARKSPETEGRGVVVLSVSHDLVDATETAAFFHLDQQDLGYAGLLATPFRGQPSDFKTRRGKLLTLSLTPGKHTIDGWRVETSINMRKPKTLPPPLAFQVREGQIVYIGSLHLRFQIEEGLFNGSVIRAVGPIVRDSEVEDIEVAEKRIPSLRGRITKQLLPLGPWR
jgi:hypothetical protein